MSSLDKLHWHKARFPSPEQFRRDLTTLYLSAAAHYDNRVLPTDLLAAWLSTTAAIYSREFPTEYKSEHQKKLIDPHGSYRLCLEVLLKSGIEFTNAFPHHVLLGDKLPLFTLAHKSLSEDIATPTLAAFSLAAAFANRRAECARYGLFQDDYAPYAWDPDDGLEEPQFSKSEPIYGDQYERRAWRAEKRNFEENELARWKERRKKFDVDHKWARENTPGWLRPLIGTPYYYDADFLDKPVQVRFDIPTERWFEGTWIVAPQGRGKTNLLRHLILNVPDNASVIVLDAKGELIQSFNSLAHLKDRMVLLEPSFPLAINPLDTGGHTIELLEYIFSAILESPLTPLQATLFRLTLTLVSTIPSATLETIREIIQNKAGWKPYEAYVRKLPKRDQDFFDLEFDSDTYKKTKQEILWRLRTLMSVPSLDMMFQSVKTKVDMPSLMDGGKFVCMNNNYEELGDQGAEFFGRFFIALIWNAARKRTKLPESQKRPVFVFIDEAHYVIARDTKIATILQQCRAQKIAIVFAHQEIQQIKNEDVRSALTNCAIKFANSTGDAFELAPRLDTSPEFLKAQTRGSFACYVRDKTPSAVSLAVPLVDMTRYPCLSPDEVRELAAKCRATYGQYTRPQQTKSAQPDGSLHWEITISPHIARRGGRRRLKTPKGEIEFSIPPNSQDGQRLRLAGCGAFDSNQVRGDLILMLKVPPMPRSGETGLFPVDDANEWG